MTSAILIFLATGHILYWLIHAFLLRGLERLAAYAPTSPALSEPPNAPFVDVLVAVRNEEHNLPRLLACLDALEYPPEKLKLIFVNDRSDDNTRNILGDYKSRSSLGVEIVDVDQTPKGRSPKKYALQKGMELCRGNIVVTTDADCRFGPGWLTELIRLFEPDVGMVVGMTTYYRELPGGEKDRTGSPPHPLLWGIQSLEFFSHAVVASSMIHNNFPINTNANNMAYRREAYRETENHRRDHHVISGDDDFLLQQMHALGKWRIVYAVSPASQVTTRPSPNVRTIWEQRKRWGSKTTHYAPRQIAFLTAVYLYYCLVVLLPLAGFLNPLYFWWGASSWVFKSWLDYRVVARACQIFSKENLLYYFLPAALLQPLIIVLVVPFGVFGTFTWKGQTTHKTAR